MHSMLVAAAVAWEVLAAPRAPPTTAVAQAPSPAGDIRRFGAICDGGAHPLSSRFADVQAARSVYPRAQSLAEEIDGHAIQRAIDEAAVGSEVLIPEGLQCRTNFTVILWKALTLRGTGTYHTRAPYDHHAQLFVIGEIAGIRFDETKPPPGVKPKPFGEQGARIIGLKIRGSSSSPGSSNAGIVLRKFWLGEIAHCHFNHLGTAIAVNGAWVFRVHENEFTDVGYAVRADPSCALCGNNDGWFQVNAFRFEHNDVSNVSFGVYLVAPGSSISLDENTIEACSSPAITVASYTKPAGIDGPVGLRGIEIRGNYFEANRTANVQLGMPSADPLRQAATAPYDVLVTQNQCNFDQAGPCVLVHALDGGRIADNSVRNGAGKNVDVVLAMPSATDVPLLRSSTIVAERGYAGPIACGTACDAVVVRPRDPSRTGRDFNRVVIANARDAATDEASAGELLAGTPQRPLAATSLLPAYVRHHREVIDGARPLKVEFAAGRYPPVRVSDLPYRIEVSPAANLGLGDVQLGGLWVSDVTRLSLHGLGRIVLAPSSPTQVAAEFANVSVDLSSVRIRFPPDGGASGTAAVEAHTGASIALDGLAFDGVARPESTFHLTGGSVTITGSAPPPGRAHVLAPESMGQLIRQGSHRRAGAPPAGAAFDAGEIIWRDPAEPGKPAGWICAARPFCSKPADFKSLPSLQ